ncbi:hypothetical protein ABZ622_38650 [Streptomyces sp. NPDC007164]|uniref:hypothetical protein n=1 Tax=Streptomyces sp. NPDC007164 TaxID=3156918 RepID=UPI0033D79EE3
MPRSHTRTDSSQLPVTVMGRPSTTPVATAPTSPSWPVNAHRNRASTSLPVAQSTPHRAAGSPSTSTALIRADRSRSPYRAASNASNCRRTPGVAPRCTCADARYTAAANRAPGPTPESSNPHT